MATYLLILFSFVQWHFGAMASVTTTPTSDCTVLLSDWRSRFVKLRQWSPFGRQYSADLTSQEHQDTDEVFAKNLADASAKVLEEAYFDLRAQGYQAVAITDQFRSMTVFEFRQRWVRGKKWILTVRRSYRFRGQILDVKNYDNGDRSYEIQKPDGSITWVPVFSYQVVLSDPAEAG